MSERRHHPAQKIKNQIDKVTKIILNVVAKNPKEPHIADDVQPSRVQKHRGQDRQKCAGYRKVRRAGKGLFEVLRNNSELKNQGVQGPRSLRRYRELEQKYQHIQCDDEIRHIWRAEPRLVVANRKHKRFGNLAIE